MSRVWHIVHNPALQNPRRQPALRPQVQYYAPAPAPFQGANLWASWHRRALTWEGGDDTAWVTAQIISKLPCGECSNHAKAHLRDNPPTFGPGAYFGWTVAFHNAVNQRLGRPVWTVPAALSEWSEAALQGPESAVATPLPTPVI